MADNVQIASDLSAAGYGPYMQDLLSNATYPFDAAVLQTQIKQAVDTVHQLAQTIQTATRSGQVTAANQLRLQLQFWLGQLQSLVRQANAKDQPAALLRALSTFSDDAIATAKAAGADVSSLTAQLKTLVKGLPIIIVVVVVGLVVWLFLKGRS